MAGKISVKERRLIIRILRVILIIAGAILVFMLVLTAVLFSNRDKISSRLLLSTNNHTHGELSFESLAFSPFRQFPDMSMKILGLEFYENPPEERNQNEKPLAQIGNVYAAINVKELLSGKVKISEIILENGKLNLIRYPDSSLNIMNSIEVVHKEELIDTMVNDTLPAQSSEFELNLEQVFFKDIRFEYENRLDRNYGLLNIDHLSASLDYTPEAIRSRLNTDIELVSLDLAGIRKSKSSGLHLETAFVFSREDLSMVLDPSLLVLDKARLNVEGEFNFSEDGSIDLIFDGSDDDFSFFSIFMSETGLDNLEEGDLYFRGRVKNNTLRGLPLIDLSFGLDKVRILVPRTAKYINNLNLSGRLNTGKRPDLSAAWLKLDTIYAELPDGFVNGSLSARNFVAPEADLNWHSKGYLSGLDQVFNFSFMDSLEGNVEILLLIDGGKYLPDQGIIRADSFKVRLDFDSAGINFPGILSIRQINGRMQHDEGITGFRDFSAKVEDSDFFIDGTIRNSLYIPFRVDTTITADLEIRSEMFDLPGFLNFVPQVRQAFPYRIKDLDLGVSVTTTTKRFLEMKPNPSMSFDIKHLSAEIENLLPPLSISQGLFELHHKDDRVNLDFQDFKINIVESDLDADLVLNSPAKRQTNLNMSIAVDKLNPGKLIWNEETDTVPAFLDGMLSGSFKLDLHFPNDSLQTLKKIDLREADLLFINARDTIETGSLRILAEDIYFDAEKDPNPFATLTADMTMGSEKSKYNSLSWVGYDFKVEAREGIYTVHPGQSRFFGKEGTGLYILDPFAESPKYEINYQVGQYDVKDFMGNFMEDSLILGKMDLMINLVLVIREDQKILHGLNGEMIMKGKDLTLYGVELDKLIRSFERSQKFNLVDLGAVMLMGPAGLAVSKGGSYAGMLVLDYSSNSSIPELVSEINIENGRILLKDLAFSTEENRVAAKGWVDLPSDSLDATFAVVDKNGCSIIEQKLYGSVKEPEKSNIRFLATIIAPVTNLLQAAAGKECEVFYNGSVKHPEKK